MSAQVADLIAAATVSVAADECCHCRRPVCRAVVTERGMVCVRCAESEPRLAVDTMPDPLGVIWLWIGLTRIGGATVVPSTGRMRVVSRATSATSDAPDLWAAAGWCLDQWQQQGGGTTHTTRQVTI